MTAAEPARAFTLGAVALSVVLYAVACASPAVAYRGGGGPGITTPSRSVIRGWDALVDGVVLVAAIFKSARLGEPVPANEYSALAWFANPVALLGAVFLLARRSTPAVVCGLLSAALASWYLAAPPKTGLGGPHAPLFGAYLWAGSFALLAGAAAIARRTCGRGTPAAGTDPPRLDVLVLTVVEVRALVGGWVLVECETGGQAVPGLRGGEAATIRRADGSTRTANVAGEESYVRTRRPGRVAFTLGGTVGIADVAGAVDVRIEFRRG